MRAIAVHFTGGFSRQDSTTRDALHPSTVSPALVSTTSQSSLTRRSRNQTRCTLRLAAATATMPSQEAKLLSDFLLAPAPLRDFMTLRQFTDILPRSHRENPAVKDLYRELHRLREAEIEVVRNDITKEVKRSRQLRRAYAQERRRTEDAHAAGIDPTALQMEEEVGVFGRQTSRAVANMQSSFPATVASSRTRCKQSMPVSKTHAKAWKHRLPTWRPTANALWPRFKRLWAR